jgi:DNA adenine methylase
MSYRDAQLNGYPGSKGGSGVAQRIIRQMPPHQTYVELFAGHATVFCVKRTAIHNLLVEIDPSTCRTLQGYLAIRSICGVNVLCEDALRVLATHPAIQDPLTLVYADPPYLRSVRTRLFYDWEFDSAEQHIRLLQAMLQANCMCMVSGYWSPLYAEMLESWRHVSYQIMTRGGVRQEYLWCNFPTPTLLHDSRFAGENYRERERIGRKRDRWARRFVAMPAAERQVIAQALMSVDAVSVTAAVRSSPSSPAVGPW